jgi:hypothetical protein
VPNEDRVALAPDPVAEERRALVDLLGSSGWTRLRDEFGKIAAPHAVLNALQAVAAQTDKVGTPFLEMELRELLADREAVKRILEWPAQRVREIDGIVKKAPEVAKGMPEMPKGLDVVRRG